VLVYDAAGNLVQDAKFYYEYDDANQLKRVRQGGSTGTIIEEYTYDAGGQRVVKKTYGAVNSVTYYVGSHYEVIQYSNGTTTRTSYYFANSERIAQKDNTGVTYYHPDHLQSSTVMTNSTGGKIDEMRYLPYGQIESGGSSTKYGYNGKEQDSGTGLDYYGARYYNPQTMHFTQPDTVIQNPYDPQMLNRYAYTRNNPIKYTDPSGHFIPALLAGGLAIAVPIAVTAVSVASVGALTFSAMYLSDAYSSGTPVTASGLADSAIAGVEYAAKVSVATCAAVVTMATGGAAGVAELPTVAASGAAAGQASIATGNVINNQPLTQGLGEPKEMCVDAAIGVVTWGAFKAGDSVLNSGKIVPYERGMQLEGGQSLYLDADADNLALFHSDLGDGYTMDIHHHPYGQGKIVVNTPETPPRDILYLETGSRKPPTNSKST
jgi:RHS repeat-associated protein